MEDPLKLYIMHLFQALKKKTFQEENSLHVIQYFIQCLFLFRENWTRVLHDIGSFQRLRDDLFKFSDELPKK